MDLLRVEHFEHRWEVFLFILVVRNCIPIGSWNRHNNRALSSPSLYSWVVPCRRNTLLSLHVCLGTDRSSSLTLILLQLFNNVSCRHQLWVESPCPRWQRGWMLFIWDLVVDMTHNFVNEMYQLIIASNIIQEGVLSILHQIFVDLLILGDSVDLV